MAFLDKNHGLTPLEKCQFFDFLNFLFLQLRKAFFGSRISSKTISQPILPKRKKVGKMAIFGPKTWVNPFGKMSIFRLFDLLVFIAQKGVFSFQNIVKHIFLAYIIFKKTMEKWPFLDQNHWLTALEKSQFFRLFELFFIAQKKVFSFQNIVTHIFLAYIAKKEKIEKSPKVFGPKPWVNPFGKIFIFRLFENLVLIAEKGFFRSRIL